MNYFQDSFFALKRSLHFRILGKFGPYDCYFSGSLDSVKKMPFEIKVEIFALNGTFYQGILTQ